MRTRRSTSNSSTFNQKHADSAAEAAQKTQFAEDARAQLDALRREQTAPGSAAAGAAWLPAGGPAGLGGAGAAAPCMAQTPFDIVANYFAADTVCARVFLELQQNLSLVATLVDHVAALAASHVAMQAALTGQIAAGIAASQGGTVGPSAAARPAPAPTGQPPAVAPPIAPNP